MLRVAVNYRLGYPYRQGIRMDIRSTEPRQCLVA